MPKRQPARVRQHELTRRRVYILPSFHGIAFALMLLVMLAGAINYTNSLGYMLVFLLTGIALVSMLMAYRNLSGLRLRFGHAAPVFAGETALLPLYLDNPLHYPRYAVTVTHEPAPGGTDEPAPVLVETGVAAAQVTDLGMPLETGRRGWLGVYRLTVATRFPLGLFRAWSPMWPDLRVLVYPRPEGHLPLPVHAALAADQGQSAFGGQEDFEGFRDYHPGDSPRRIYWKAEARDQGLMTKVFEGGAAGDLVLRWSDAGPAAVEPRLSQLCRWVLEAHKRGFRYGLDLPGLRLEPGGGEPHLRRCLEALAVFEAVR